MLLPSPPDDKQKYAYVDQNKLSIYSFGLTSYIALMIGMVLFTFHHAHIIPYAIFTLLVGLYLGISYFIGIFGRPFNLNRHGDILEAYGTYWPSVDVFLPTAGEPIEILANTYHWVSKLEWRGRLNVYVLDDAHEATVKALADKYKYNYIARPDHGVLKKAGNIRYAFGQTSGEFILILDADFCPRSEMLREMIPYFGASPELAIVQTPQFFEIKNKQSLIERGSAYVQELFYRLVQTNRDRWGAAICVGTCAVYRRAALAPHGGTYPIEYSEDLHTGWQALVDGWRLKYMPLNLSKGICPDTMASYFIQQLRWCTGSTSLLTSRAFWGHPLPVMTRVCYLSGMLYYVATAMSVILAPLPGIIMVWFFPNEVFWYNYLFSLPSLLLGTVVLALWGRAPFGEHAIIARHIAYYAHLFALFDRMRGRIQAWIPTGDNKATRASHRYEYFKTTMFTWATVCLLLAWTGCFFNLTRYSVYNFLPLMFFSTYGYWGQVAAFKNEA